MLVSDFDYDLPDDLIAQEPAPRGTSRLLALERASGAIRHQTVAALPDLLHQGDLLVVNDTRVFAARLLGRRVPSGGAVECLLIGVPQPLADGSGSAEGEALVHPGQKLKPGAILRIEGPSGALLCEILDQKFFGRRRIRLMPERGGDVNTLIEELGHVPLPPYIRRPDTTADRERYQTMFAAVPGSVAAPTAGLHFTPALLAELTTRGIEQVSVTLHVGYGTFKPIRTDRVDEHVMDPERYEIAPETARRINEARDEGRRVIAVGTTTTRALEDAATRGGGRVEAGWADAVTFIRPGFRFQAIDGLLTNFHVPRSSLLMLVCAFAGRTQVLNAYREAVRQRYRFYSYGDAMLIR